MFFEIVFHFWHFLKTFFTIMCLRAETFWSSFFWLKRKFSYSEIFWKLSETKEKYHISRRGKEGERGNWFLNGISYCLLLLKNYEFFKEKKKRNRPYTQLMIFLSFFWFFIHKICLNVKISKLWTERKTSTKIIKNLKKTSLQTKKTET